MNLTQVIESQWMNIDLWISPNYMPHIFRFLSADPVASKLPSDDMSKLRTGSLCPQRFKSSFIESTQQTFSVQSSKEKVKNSPFGENLMPITSSVVSIFSQNCSLTVPDAYQARVWNLIVLSAEADAINKEPFKPDGFVWYATSQISRL